MRAGHHFQITIIKALSDSRAGKGSLTHRCYRCPRLRRAPMVSMASGAEAHGALTGTVVIAMKAQPRRKLAWTQPTLNGSLCLRRWQCLI